MRTAKEEKSMKVGKWVGGLAVDRTETWVVAGGGSKQLFQFHLPSGVRSWLSPSSCQIQSLSFVDNKVYTLSLFMCFVLFSWFNRLFVLEMKAMYTIIVSVVIYWKKYQQPFPLCLVYQSIKLQKIKYGELFFSLLFFYLH